MLKVRLLGSSQDRTPHQMLRLDIERALRQLPREEARAVALYYLAGQPIRDIAVRLSRPEGTIRRWLHQGRRRQP